jgi:hypothetical protein
MALAFKCPSSYSTLKASIASQILTTTGGARLDPRLAYHQQHRHRLQHLEVRDVGRDMNP